MKDSLQVVVPESQSHASTMCAGSHAFARRTCLGWRLPCIQRVRKSIDRSRRSQSQDACTVAPQTTSELGVLDCETFGPSLCCESPHPDHWEMLLHHTVSSDTQSTFHIEWALFLAHRLMLELHSAPVAQLFRCSVGWTMLLLFASHA